MSFFNKKNNNCLSEKNLNQSSLTSKNNISELDKDSYIMENKFSEINPFESKIENITGASEIGNNYQ